LKIRGEKANDEPLDSDDIFKLLIMTFKSDLLISIVFACLERVARLGFSVLLLYLFNAVADGNYTIAYIYCAIEMIIWYFRNLFNHVVFLEA